MEVVGVLGLWYGGSMKKDFDEWNAVKKDVHGSGVRALFKNREVWWCQIGANVGYEIDGKQGLFVRPVLVLRKISADTFVGIPLTKKKKDTITRKNLTHLYYILRENIQGDDGRGYCSTLDLSQIRLFDARRLISRKYRIHENTFRKVKAGIQELLL